MSVGLGLDLVEVERFRRVLERRPRLAERCFSEAERAGLAGRGDPVPGLAARFAAKEATMKALGVGIGAFALRDVEVVRLASGRPELRLSGRAAQRAAQLGLSELAVSLSHTANVAAAVVSAR